jgi:hypothetical protein
LNKIGKCNLGQASSNKSENPAFSVVQSGSHDLQMKFKTFRSIFIDLG